MTGIDCTISDHVARVTIDRPEVLNAISAEAEADLIAIFDDLETNRDVRVIVLTGTGDRAFCVGADMSGGDSDDGSEDGSGDEAGEGASEGLAYWAKERPGGFGGISLRTTLDVPVIARVNGYALGGGMEMVLGCDLVVAAEHALFGLPEARVGRLPVTGGITRLPRRIPHAWAMELLLTGNRIDAHRAAEMGLVNRVVAADALDDTVDGLVDDVLACAPLSLRATKQIVQRTAHLTAEEAQQARLPALVEALDSDDSREGVAAFRDKRAPQWTGT